MVFGTDGDYSYQNIKFYVDGEEIAVGCGQDWGAWTYELPDNPFVIGRAGDLYNYFSGSIDDVAIWDRALTASEIENLFSETNQNSSCDTSTFSNTSGLIGYWPFCNNSNDQSLNNNNGTVNGANITEDRFGNSSSAYSFDGTDDYINMNNPILTGENSITYSFWAYTESNEAMDVMGQFCLDDTTDCDNLKNIRIALNGSQTDGGCGYEGLSFKSPAHYATAAFSSVSDNSTECFNTANISLIVNELPDLSEVTNIELCDYNNTGDEIEEFNLENSISNIVENQPEISVTFYENEQDAINSENEISVNYSNTSNSQTIYVRADSDSNDCFAINSFELTVSPVENVTGENEQSFCQSATIDDLIVNGNNITWYNSIDQENILELSYNLTNGETVYATQTIDNCESQELFSVTVSINENPTPVVAGNNTQTFQAK